jgi:5-methylcytosine-specific restriction enzyme A
MPGDSYYRSSAWKKLRSTALKRDNHRCVVLGCTEAARTVDHIVPRKQGGADVLSNLRCLCAEHDNQSHREKRGGGPRQERFVVRGCDGNGVPIDPSHHWRGMQQARGQGGQITSHCEASFGSLVYVRRRQFQGGPLRR